MKHCKKGRKFGRKRDQRKALMKSLLVNLILKEKIKTTEAKAKELRPLIEKTITRGRKADMGKNLASVKHLAEVLPAVARKKLITQIAPRYKDRTGGYTRIIKTNPRRTDGAEMAFIELV
ncbi:MAG: 50S ribosomal protein L17 [bacterium]